MFIKNTLREFLYFGVKQAWACLFGGALLFLILLTKLCWTDHIPIARYDALFVLAILLQAGLILTKLERWEEAKVIFLFHIVGTIMEIFKTHVGSWHYPEDNLIRIAGVPLFSGFMYSAVGSYIARIWRIFDMKFTHYPRQELAILLCILVYLNFFTHHYIYDIRYFLFAFTIALYGRTWVHFKPNRTHYKMPLLLGFALVAFFIWIAENVGTFGTIWHYPNQKSAWQMVSFTKMGSWFLLMIISFVLVSLLHRIQRPEERME